jgi:hypothetical protein
MTNAATLHDLNASALGHVIGCPASEKIDFDERAAGESGDADAGSCRQPSRCKIGLIDGVHRCVIPLELGQVDASEYDLVAHMDYMHFNPMKHRLVGHSANGPHFSFRRCVANGRYPAGWVGGGDEPRGRASSGESETESERSATGDGSRRKTLRFSALRLLPFICRFGRRRPAAGAAIGTACRGTPDFATASSLAASPLLFGRWARGCIDPLRPRARGLRAAGSRTRMAAR